MTEVHYSPDGDDETLCGRPADRARTDDALGFVLTKAGKTGDDPCPDCADAVEAMSDELVGY